MISRRRWTLIATTVVAVLVTLAAIFWRPIVLTLPKSTIEAYLLRKLPPETPKENVLEFARARHVSVKADVRTTEARFVRMHLGHYRFLFRTDVVAFVRLNDNDRVVAIDVKKYTDSL